MTTKSREADREAFEKWAREHFPHDTASYERNVDRIETAHSAFEFAVAWSRSQALEEAAQAAERTDAAWCVDTLVGAHIVDAIRALKDQK